MNPTSDHVRAEQHPVLQQLQQLIDGVTTAEKAHLAHIQELERNLGLSAMALDETRAENFLLRMQAEQRDREVAELRATVARADKRIKRAARVLTEDEEEESDYETSSPRLTSSSSSAASCDPDSASGPPPPKRVAREASAEDGETGNEEDRNHMDSVPCDHASPMSLSEHAPSTTPLPRSQPLGAVYRRSKRQEVVDRLRDCRVGIRLLDATQQFTIIPVTQEHLPVLQKGPGPSSLLQKLVGHATLCRICCGRRLCPSTKLEQLTPCNVCPE